MIERLAPILNAGILGLEQLADAIWLSQQLPDAALGGAQTSASTSRPARTSVVTAHGSRSGSAEQGIAQRQTSQQAAVQQDVIARTRLSDARAGQRLRSRGVAPLSRRIEIARALRPLGWQVSVPDRWQLLEHATADRIAHTGLWIPVVEPEREAAFDLVMVVDCDPRLRPWRDLIHALTAVVRSSGRLRNVATWTIDGHEREARLHAGVGGPRRARHVVDPTGRTVVLVVSDFAGALWREGQGLACLRIWARRMSTTLLSLLPERLWDRAVLGGMAAGVVFARRPGQASATLGHETPLDRDAVALPIITVDPTSLRAWAALVAGDVRSRLTSLAVLPDPSLETRALAVARAVLRADGDDQADANALARHTQRVYRHLDTVRRARDAEDPVDRFRRRVSPSVARLAAALVRGPLRMDIMQLVQRVISPTTGPLELAEVLGSGLFSLRPEVDEREGSVWFDVAPYMRVRIADLAPARDGVHVLEVVGRYIRDHLGGGYDFEALVVDPGSEPGPVPEELRPFAQVYVEQLRQLGGRYRELANRLARAALGAEDPAPSAAEAVIEIGDRLQVDGDASTAPLLADLEHGPLSLEARQRDARLPAGELPASHEDLEQAEEHASRRRADFGLVVGVDQYSNRLAASGAVADANQFREWLCDIRGGGVRPEHVKCLLSTPDPPSPLQHHVDHDLIALCRHADAIGGGRRLYFYFSGHGADSPREEDDTGLLLLEHSSKLSQLALSATSYLHALRNGPFEEVVMLLDVSRGTSRPVFAARPTFSLQPNPQRPHAMQFIASTARSRRTTFEVPHSEHGQGVLTRSLLHVLRQSPEITVGDLKYALRNEMGTSGQRVEILDGLRSDSYFLSQDRKRGFNVVIEFSRARGRVGLRDGKLRIVAEYDGSPKVWMLQLDEGLYRLEDELGEHVAFEVKHDTTHVAF
jgi:hypothetical protein